MALTVKQWREVVSEAAVLMGGGWEVAGKGSSTSLMRSDPQWWLQFVYQEKTSNGRMVAYQGLLSYPLPSTQSGMGGAAGDQFKVPDHPEIRFRDVSDPKVVAEFARCTSELKLHDRYDVSGVREASDRKYVENCAAGREDYIYRGITLQHLIALRVLSGSRPLPDLVADVRRVLDDDDWLYGIWGDRTADSGEARLRAYWEDLYARIQTGDRQSVEELFAQTRVDTLKWFGLSDAQITDPVFPELEVPW
ncbi:hypothetical protein [Gordonia alkaliphila]|uniref:Uncharacterized protein n=1 Tax=Gordonia alkaliphila TaxID=1053547 RepID=A0ABP8ZBH5_9ACTN